MLLKCNCQHPAPIVMLSESAGNWRTEYLKKFSFTYPENYIPFCQIIICIIMQIIMSITMCHSATIFITLFIGGTSKYHFNKLCCGCLLGKVNNQKVDIIKHRIIYLLTMVHNSIIYLFIYTSQKYIIIHFALNIRRHCFLKQSSAKYSCVANKAITDESKSLFLSIPK